MVGENVGNEIKVELIKRGIDRNKIVSILMCSYFCFDWDKITNHYNKNCVSEVMYMEHDDISNVPEPMIPNLDNMTIFSMHCAGGCLYHSINMRFFSPTINLFFKLDDYLKFLMNPKRYIEKTPSFLRFDYIKGNKVKEYPVYRLYDIELNMNHCFSVKEGLEKWEERKGRIVWDNIVVLAYTNSSEVLSLIDDLPYKKKICFVPFDSDLKSAFSVDMDQMIQKNLWDVVNRICLKEYPYYFNKLLERLQSN